ncbi:MAG: hypothetical protein PF440_07105, partial [Thiomicrorhabdus sp.]|nr:hypothetical protein [Thiomicrorhabdus sp.]
MKILLYPYTEVDGIRTYSDSVIEKLFLRTEEDSLVKTVFYDGTVKTKEQFLAAMKYGECLFYIVYIDTKIVGYAWLNRFENHT